MTHRFGENWADSFEVLHQEDPNHFGLRVGDRVVLEEPHPHAGKVGTVDAFPKLALLLNEERPRVRFADGSVCFIIRESEFTRLPPPRAARRGRR